MSRPHLLIGITAACAVITLTTPKSWLRLPVLGVGFSCGFTYLLHAGIQWRRENQHVIEWSDRYLLLLKTNHSIEKSLADKQQELEELSKLTDAELDAITKERQQHITNLNNQIEELTQLLDEQLAEIDQREWL